MPSALSSMVRVLTWTTLLSASAWADLKDRYRLPDGGHERPFVIATDEVQAKSLIQQRRRKVTLAGIATAEGARQAAIRQRKATGEEVDLVLYEEGLPRNEFTRRILTRKLAVKLAPGTNPETVATKHGLTSDGPAAGAPGWFIFTAPEAGQSLEVLEAILLERGVEAAQPQLARNRQKRLIPNDTLFASQWHLRNTGQGNGLAGTDVNVTSVWDTYRGAGIRIGIVDDGLQTTHPDLAPNVDTVNDHDWNDSTPNTPDPDVNEDFHGTSCAGVAAGRGNNGIGISGAAPEATLVGLRLIAAPDTDQDDADAMNWKNDLIQVKSNSWGPSDNAQTLEAPGTLMQAALLNGIQNGRGGKGTIYVWAAGNGGEAGDNSNYDGYANSIYTIAVAAVDNTGNQSYYSEPGANVLIAAPSDGGPLGITTTDLVGTNGYNTFNPLVHADYTDDFGGTSSACPLAAGVIALILEANPNLGWRDVQEILIRSASKVKPSDTDWVNNAAGFHFNHKFGAGLVNAQAAVTLASTWTNLGAYQNVSSSQNNLALSIPDNSTTGVTRTFNIGTNLRVERVTVRVNIAHTNRGDLEVTLTSPGGTVSRLAERHGDTNNDYTNWTFSTVRSWGENSLGDWTLKVTDRRASTTGVLTSATVTVYGGPGNVPATVTAATVSPAGPVYFDQTLTVGGVTATDPEGDAITLAYQWEQSGDGVDFTAINGATAAALPLTSAQSGKVVRCAVRGVSQNLQGAPFYTSAVPVNRRPVEAARSGVAYSYDSDLFPAGGLGAARSLLINEFSQGPSGTKEWVELLVLKTSDLRGYTLRDLGGVYATFSQALAWSQVKAGTLIVIYNPGDRDPLLPADDLDPADYQMVVPVTSAALFTGGTWPGLSNAAGENVNIRDASAVVVDGVSFTSNTTYTPSLAAVGSAKAAANLGGSDAAAELAANWSIIAASAATPGAANGGANTTFLNVLRNGPAFRLGATSEVVPGLSIDPATGLLSGTPNVPAGGLFRIVIEREGASVASQSYPLLVADANGDYVIPAGKTLTLDQPLTLEGNLSIAGTLDTAGFALAVNGAIVETPGATVSNGQGSIGYLSRRGTPLPGTTLLLANATNDLADPDGDSVSNLMEFKLGMDPSEGTLLGLPVVERVDGHLTLTYATPAGAAGVDATVEVSGNLTAWQSGPGQTEVVSDTVTNGIRTVVVRDISTAGARFIRLKAHR